MQVVELKPMGIGEVLDGAFRIYRAKFKTFLSLVLKFGLPAYALYYLLNFLAFDSFYSSGIGFGLLLIFLASIFTVIISTALTNSFNLIAADSVSPPEQERKSYFKDGLSRVLVMIGISIVLFILIGVGLIFLIIPGIILLVLFSFTGIYAVVEKRGVFDSISKSSSLVSGRFFKVLGSWIVIGIVLIAVSLAVWGILSIIAAIIGVSAELGSGIVSQMIKQAGQSFMDSISSMGIAEIESGATTSLVQTIFDAFNQIINLIVVSPLLASATTLLYYSLRAEKEGLDIRQMAEQMAVISENSGTGE